MKKYDKKKILINYDYSLAPITTAYYYEEVLRRHPLYKGYRLGQLDPSKADAIINFETCDEVVVCSKVPSSYYEIDNHLIKGLEYWKYNPVDFVFVAQNFNIELYPFGKTSYLPLAADPNKHKPISGITEIYDIGFIGNQNYTRRKQLLQILDQNFNCLITESAPGLPYSEKLSACRILFNCSMQHDVNMRFFESMSIGKILVSDYLPEQDQFAYDKCHYYAYRNRYEMVAIIKKLLRSPNHRKAVGDMSRHNIIKNHTYKHRLEQMLSVMGVNKCQSK
jgi:hypothetical protein